MKTIMRTILVLMITAIIAMGYFTSSGVYNMAATEKHWLVTEKLIEWMRISSIAVRADELEVPKMDEDRYLSIGAEHYDAMCTVCHLSPGQQPTELAQGLYPQAPVFDQQTPPNDPNVLETQSKAYFWVIKNGIKMTAMPAWGLTHDDESIWAMTFFVQRLAGMSADTYRNLIDSQDGHGHTHDGTHAHGHGHGHGHGHADDNEADSDDPHEHAADSHDDDADHAPHTHDATVEAHETVDERDE